MPKVADGCPHSIFLETIDFNLDFGGGFMVLAPVVASREFFENGAHPLFRVFSTAAKVKNRLVG